MPIRKKIEDSFELWGRAIIRHRWPVIAVMLAMTAGLGSFLPQVRVDNSDEAFLKKSAEERVRYDRFKQRFGAEDRINVILVPPKVFDLDFLARLRRIHEEIEEEAPYVEEITSLLNARNTRGDADELIVEDLLEDWPETQADLDALRQRALSNPLLQNVLLSENASLTLISVKPFLYTTHLPEEDALAGFDDIEGEARPTQPPYLSEAEGAELVGSIQQIVSRHEGPELEIHLIGGPVIDQALAVVLQRDVSLSLSLSLIIIAGLLLLLFRRLSGVVLPIVVVLSSMISTMGLMVLFDIPFSITLNIVPAFLLVVGVCDSIHILVIVYQRLSAGRERDDAIAEALGHSGLAVLMTSLTTAAGLVSFSAANLAPVAQLGLIAPLGVLLAMLYSLVLLPALLAITPLRAAPFGTSPEQNRPFEILLERLGHLATGYPRGVLACVAVLVLIGAGGIARLHFSHDGMRWFPEEDPVRVAAELIDREFKGSASLEALLYTGRENGLHEPETLRRIEDALGRSMLLEVGERPVAKTISLVDIVKEIHQALNENDARFHALPDDRQLIAQELLLFENSGTDDLEDVTDSQFEMARLSIRTPWVDAMLYPDFVDRVDAIFRDVFPGDVRYELTGAPVLFSKVFRGLVLSMARSYAIALLIITPMLVLLVGDLKRGLLAMIPNLIPIYLVLAWMGWTNIPLDVSTLLIGSVLLGVAVDDTIHFMHKYNRYYEDLGDSRAAVHATLATTGSALLFTSLILSLGFAVFMTSYLNNVYWFGMLISMAAVIAFLADVVVAPALMVLASGERPKPARRPAANLPPRV